MIKRVKRYIPKKVKVAVRHAKNLRRHRLPDQPQPITSDYSDNLVVNHPQLLDDAKIVFRGSGNILYCESGDIKLRNCSIVFDGNNSVIYLSKNRGNTYSISISVRHNSVVYIGRNNYFNGGSTLLATEQKHIIIGDEGLFSFGCWLRTADGHPMYGVETNERLNQSKSILIGDHVWIGQDVLILKGSEIGSGSIVGARSIVTNKRLLSNSLYVGAPLKRIRQGVFFLRDSVHSFTDQQTEDSQYCNGAEWIYEDDGLQRLEISKIDSDLSLTTNSADKLNYIQSNLAVNNKRNRFYIGD